ncbi:hypothetical protein JOL62DRAFT_349753 [Phyllosticta paracitricarpa]|uniref:Uncharacterized protein n=1 Tax=Phyllosticta paracitricarpa TaxID=2016321 RepID=A0ABR1NGF6_9PEZI
MKLSLLREQCVNTDKTSRIVSSEQGDQIDNNNCFIHKTPAIALSPRVRLLRRRTIRPDDLRPTSKQASGVSGLVRKNHFTSQSTSLVLQCFSDEFSKINSTSSSIASRMNVVRLVLRLPPEILALNGREIAPSSSRISVCLHTSHTTTTTTTTGGRGKARKKKKKKERKKEKKKERKEERKKKKEKDDSLSTNLKNNRLRAHIQSPRHGLHHLIIGAAHRRIYDDAALDQRSAGRRVNVVPAH